MFEANADTVTSAGVTIDGSGKTGLGLALRQSSLAASLLFSHLVSLRGHLDDVQHVRWGSIFFGTLILRPSMHLDRLALAFQSYSRQTIVFWSLSMRSSWRYCPAQKRPETGTPLYWSSSLRPFSRRFYRLTHLFRASLSRHPRLSSECFPSPATDC